MVRLFNFNPNFTATAKEQEPKKAKIKQQFLKNITVLALQTLKYCVRVLLSGGAKAGGWGSCQHLLFRTSDRTGIFGSS